MRAKGMAYDTGFVRHGEISRARFDPEVVRRELAIIRDDLHCNAVQLIGGEPERLELAAGYAAELGLEVWFSPYPLELTAGEILALFADCAERAERLRKAGAEVVFVTGVELSLMNPGFLPGNTLEERLGRLLGEPDRRERLAEVSARVNAFLGQAVAAVREHFRGRITYAAIPVERVDWTPFDIVSVELIRSAEVASQYRDGVRALVNGEYVRDEAGQATDLREVLEIFDSEGVDGTFVFMFALENLPHRPDDDPRLDLDMASPGIVKVLAGRHGDTYPDMEWEPKAAFTTVAECYGR